MHVVDAMLLMLLALGDVALMFHLRRARWRRLRQQRMGKALRIAVHRDDREEPSRRLSAWKMRRAG
jgi:hypothetical protein